MFAGPTRAQAQYFNNRLTVRVRARPTETHVLPASPETYGAMYSDYRNQLWLTDVVVLKRCGLWCVTPTSSGSYTTTPAVFVPLMNMDGSEFKVSAKIEHVLFETPPSDSATFTVVDWHTECHLYMVNPVAFSR